MTIQKAIEGCLRCGEPKKAKQDTYCSLGCWYATLRKPKAACLICGEPVKTSQNRMCSVSCSNYYKYADKKNHPNWKGGKEVWLTKVRNKNWRPLQQWRAQVFKRDNGTCQICGTNEGKMQADHIKPFQFFSELRYEVSNGRVLCEPCHVKTPTYGKKLGSIDEYFASL